MCAPHIMQYVRSRLSRRDLFKLAAGSAATLSAGTLAAGLSRAHAQAAPAMTLNIANLADLTHSLSPDFPVFPGFQPMRINTLVTVENDGFYATRWDVGEHTGTHLDAPAHFIAGATTADAIGLEQLIAPLAVIDIAARAEEDPDALLMVDDILAWESQHGELPAGAAVMMYSGWEARLADSAAFVGADEQGVLHFPGFAPEAADFLVSERDIVGIGVDTLSLDHGPSQGFESHLITLGAGKWGLENVANLASIPAAGAHVIVGNLKVAEASGGPVRVMAAWG